ncbi:hypothetical protein ACQ86B_03660 [Mycolicibacterium aichiense]|uniref:hypothetical protein n=1 Tax=Mycolicibacterium aichiense TaxID=1799 RepID=UPI003D67DF1B
MGSPRENRIAVNKIFGSELPQESSDERDPEPDRDRDDRDEWLRENVPPHHGG